MQTAVAVVPYAVAIFAAAVMVVRLYRWLSPRLLGVVGFALVAVGLVVLGFSIRNDWGTPVVVLGLLVLGLGEGALITLLFNVLVSSSPSAWPATWAAFRGTANNLASAVGTALASTMSVGLLGFFILGSLAGNQLLPVQLQAQVNLDNITFVSNDQLLETLDATSAAPDQVAEAMRINIEARLPRARGVVPGFGGHRLPGDLPGVRTAQLMTVRLPMASPPILSEPAGE